MAVMETSQVRLSAAQRQQFENEGYVIVRNVLSADEVERFKVRAREYALGQLPPGGEKMIVHDVRVAKGLLKPTDPERGIWKYLNPDRFDPLFREYPTYPGLLDVVEDVLGPDIKAFLLMFIYKPPAVEFVHPYHQDAYYFPFEPHDLCLGTWVALDHTAADNGTLTVVRGSHRLPVLPHSAPQGDGANYGVFGVDGYDGHPDEVVLELQPGDGVFFHSRLLHKTGSNTSDRHRRVLTVHYASARCRFTGEPDKRLGFRLVRGQNHEGCI